MLTKKISVTMMLLILVSCAIAGCQQKHHASYYSSVRYESPPVDGFLSYTLERDRDWANGNRELRIMREEADRNREYRTLPALELLTGGRDVDETVDRLYGAADGN